MQMQTQLHLFLLPACKTIKQLNPLLSQLIITGLTHNSFHLCNLIHHLTLFSHHNNNTSSSFLLYSRLLLQQQQQQQSYHHTTISSSTLSFLYNTIIRAYSRTHFPQQGLVIYIQMLRNCSKPDNYTFPFLVKAVSGLREGTQVHGQILRYGFSLNVFVLNTLLNMYAMFGEMGFAQKLFDESPELLDIVSWNSIIDGYVKYGDVEKARRLFDKMPERNEISWTSMISGYTRNGDLDIAKTLFDRIMPVCRNAGTWNSMISGFAKCGMLSMARKLFDEMPERNIVSWNSMVSAYAQSGEVELARSLFDEMPEKDVFSWSCMISGYAQNDRGGDALKLFRSMLEQNRVRPNEVTLVSVLSVCGQLAALDQGKWVHGYIERNGMRLSNNLGAALVDMYAKCGCVETAIEEFWKLDYRNVSTWNALITGLAVNGAAQDALEVFREMQRSKTKPNSITFVGVLMACCHGGLVEEGCQHLQSMSKNYGIEPEMKHYGCVVDLLGRAGRLEEAEEMVRNMPMKPDVMVLGALLGACRIHGDFAIAERVRRNFLELNSEQAGCHVLLSNIYAAAGKWAEALDMRSILTTNQIKKNAGLSSVELSRI